MTYGNVLRLLEGFRLISSYTSTDGSRRTNNFGTETYKVARAIKNLEAIEKEFLEFRDEIIKRYNPDNHMDVSNEVRRQIEKEYGLLFSSDVDVQLPKIDYEAIVTDSNVVSAEALAVVYDCLTNTPEEY